MANFGYCIYRVACFDFIPCLELWLNGQFQLLVVGVGLDEVDESFNAGIVNRFICFISEIYPAVRIKIPTIYSCIISKFFKCRLDFFGSGGFTLNVGSSLFLS